MKKLIILAMLSLSGCIHSDNEESASCDTGVYDYVGCWKTQECKQAINTEGNLINSWIDSQYDFKSSGVIEILGYEYKDSSCSGNAAIILGDSEVLVNHSFVDVVTNSDGVEGSEVKITMTFPSDTLEVNGGIFIVEEDLLCSTKSFSFGARNFRVSEAGLAKDTELYENCLVKGRLP